MKKRIFSLLLAVVMLVGVIPGTLFTAFATEPATITVGGMTAPIAGHTLEDWVTANQPSLTLSCGFEEIHLFEGKVTNLAETNEAVEVNDLEYTFAEGDYTFMFIADPVAGEPTVVCPGASATSYYTNGVYGYVFVTYAAYDAATITVGGMTAPTAGQTLYDWAMATVPSLTLSCGEFEELFLFEGKVTNLAETSEAVEVDYPEYTFAEGDYTFVFIVDPVEGEPTVVCPGASATSYDTYGEVGFVFVNYAVCAANIVIENLLLPEAGQNMNEYGNVVFETLLDGYFTVNGGVFDAESGTFGDVLFAGYEFLDGSMDYIEDYETFEFAPGTYYMAIYLGEEFDENSIATVDGVACEVHREATWPAGCVEVLIEFNVTEEGTTIVPYVAPDADIIIEDLPLPEVGITYEDYMDIFVASDVTINDAALDIDDWTFGSIGVDFCALLNGSAYELDRDDVIVPGTYYFGFVIIRDFNYSTTAIANGADSMVFWNDEMPSGMVQVLVELNVTEEGTTVVPYVAPEAYIDEIEITIPDLIAGSDVPDASDITLGDSSYTVESVEVFDFALGENVAEIKNNEVYSILISLVAEPGYEFGDAELIVTNEGVEIDYYTYARWAEIELVVRVGDPTPYLVYFQPNGAITEGGYRYFEYTNGSYTLPECMYTPPVGKAFDKWNVRLNDSFYGSFQPGESIQVTGDMYIYAIWKTATYFVDCDPGPFASGSVRRITKTYGVNVTLPGAVFTRTGYTMIGWSTDATATEAQYAPDALYTADAAVTLYPVWQKDAVTYTVNCDPGPYASGSVAQRTKLEGESTTLPGAIFSRSGYTMIGWSTDGTATEAQYALNATYSADANVTLFPVWQKTTFKVTVTGTYFVNNFESKAYRGQNYYNYRIDPATGYVLPEDITIKVGDTVLVKGTDYSYYAGTQQLTIYGSVITDDITITINCLKEVVATLENITFDSAAEGYTPSVKPIIMTNNGAGHLNNPDIEFISGSEYFTIQYYGGMGQLTSGTTDSTHYGIIPKKDLPMGIYTAKIKLTGVGYEEAATATVTFTVTGTAPTTFNLEMDYDAFIISPEFTEGELDDIILDHTESLDSWCSVDWLNTRLMYYPAGSNTLHGLGDGTNNVDPSKRYVFSLRVDLKSYCSWSEDILNGDFSDITVVINGVECEVGRVTYNEYWNSLEIIVKPNWNRVKLLGDVDDDGFVTNADVLALYKYIYNPILYPLDVTVADVNKDAIISNADVLDIYRYIYNPELYPLG